MAPVVTIDGPSGSGKGTIGLGLAKHLGWHFLDSGSIYRAAALAAQRLGVNADQVERIADIARRMDLRFEDGRVVLEGEDVTDVLRTETTGNLASRVAAVPAVREALLDWQRSCARPPGLVADGRDMGTVVFPEAELKIFLTASAEERALRRYNQLKEKGFDVSLPDLIAEIEERDARDRDRSTAPLQVPAAALVVDSTALTIEEVLNRVLERAREIFPELVK
jgi:cytidylate kinase